MSIESEFHPLANIFPMMEGQEWEEFKKDIKANGVIDVIMWHEAKIVDGRNRYKAATELGIECRHADLPEGTDPLSYVLSKNLHRRQLTVGQRSMIADDVRNLKAGNPKYTATSKILDVPAVSIKQAADKLGVSTEAIRQARNIKRDAAPEVVEAVKQGRMSLNAADKTIKTKPLSNTAKDMLKKASPEVIKAVEEGRMTVSAALKSINHPSAKSEPTQKEADALWSVKYKELKAEHDSLVLEYAKVVDENAQLKLKIAELMQ